MKRFAVGLAGYLVIMLLTVQLSSAAAKGRMSGDNVGVDAFREALGAAELDRVERNRRLDAAMQGILGQMLSERQAQDRIMSQVVMAVVRVMLDRAQALENKAFIMRRDNPNIDRSLRNIARLYGEHWRKYNKNQKIGAAMAWRDLVDLAGGGRLEDGTVLQHRDMVELSMYIELTEDAKTLGEIRTPLPLDIVEAEAFSRVLFTPFEDRRKAGFPEEWDDAPLFNQKGEKIEPRKMGAEQR